MGQGSPVIASHRARLADLIPTPLCRRAGWAVLTPVRFF